MREINPVGLIIQRGKVQVKQTIKIIFTMSKPIISINLRPANYGGYVELANRVIASITSNLNFLTPAVTVLSLQTATTNVETAIAVWGPKGNRGSHVDLEDLR